MPSKILSALTQGADGYIVEVVLFFRAERDVILPPYTSKLPRTVLYRDECMRRVRSLYESRTAMRPVTLSVIYRGGRPFYKRRPDSPPLSARAGEVFTARIAVYARDDVDPLSLAAEMAGCGGRLPDPFDAITYGVSEVRIEDVKSLSPQHSLGRGFTVHIETPVLLDTRLMAPPGLWGTRLIHRIPQHYRLMPTPGYIAAAATRLWVALALGWTDPYDVARAGYVVGRMAEVMMAETGYSIRPVTVIYGRDGAGRLRKARGPVGTVTLKPLHPRVVEVLEKPLALAERMGLGKSRSIGFGAVRITPAPHQASREESDAGARTPE